MLTNRHSFLVLSAAIVVSTWLSASPGCAKQLNPPPDEVIHRYMGLTWYGHSCFVLKTRSGVKIAFDPYKTGSGINYSPGKIKADVVFISHNHFDHNNVGLIAGNPKIIRPIARGQRSGTVQVARTRIAYKSIFTHHDAIGGKERGGNTVHVVMVDGLRIAHLGDLGAPLTSEQVREIGRVDILLVPVGGKFTIDANGASRVVDQLKPQVAVPMHYKTPKVDLPLSGVEPFLKGKKDIFRNGHTHSFDPEKRLMGTMILVLEYRD